MSNTITVDGKQIEVRKAKATELRAYLGEFYKGRTAEVREFGKAEHIFMLENNYDLDDMIRAKNDNQYPYDASGVFSPASATKSAPKPEFKGGALEQMIIQGVKESLDLDDLINQQEIERKIESLVRDHTGSLMESVEEKINQVRRIEYEVVDPAGDITPVGLQHYRFPQLLKIVAGREHVALVGPAGSGKSTAVENVAVALDLPFYSISCNPQSSKVDFFGYNDANGKYIETDFYKAVTGGGVFMADEMDSANPQILVAVNACTGGNKYASFPNGTVEIHEDFVMVTGMNTFGRGADRTYVGRNQLDGATNDRFPALAWDYDESLERQLAKNDKWVDKVQAIRKVVFDNKIRHVVSPRASIKGATFLKMGFSEEEVLEMVVWKGLDKSTRHSIESQI